MTDTLATVTPIRSDAGPTCAYCGDPATVMDHVHARSDGGPNDTSNLVDACGPCNSSKGGAPVAEWLARVVMKPSLGDRNQRIIERLKTGRIARRLGPTRPGWTSLVNGDEEEDLEDRVIFDSLVACVAQAAYQNLWGAMADSHLRSNRLLGVLGDEWVGYRGHLWGNGLTP